MSASNALQKAEVAALRASTALSVLTGGVARIFDHVPDEVAFPYVRIGEHQEVDDSTTADRGFEVYSTVHTWSRASGRVEVKALNAAVRDALDAPLTLTGFRLVSRDFVDARVMDDPDGLTKHGVVTLRYLIRPE